jgi:4-hydroxybenzoate polyprenyltransferase
MNKYEEKSSKSLILEDATQSNWVDLYCPLWISPFLKLSRLDRPIGTWLLLIPCWWGLGLAVLGQNESFSGKDIWIFFACILGAILMRGAGCTWNDISDIKLDALVKRTKFRPLPSGQVSVRSAIIWMLIQTLLSFIILLTFNNNAIIIGIIGLIPVIIYPFSKRFTWWPQFFLGIAFNWGVLLAYTAQTGKLDSQVLFLYLSGIFWTLFYDTIYAYQDIEDDALIGIKSTARLFGSLPHKWLLLFAILCCIFMEISFYTAFRTGTLVFTIISTVSIILFFTHLVYQVRRLEVNNSISCLSLFKSNKNAGLIIAFALFLQIILFLPLNN